MGFGSLLKNLFGSKPAAISEDPFGSKPLPSAQPAPAEPPPARRRDPEIMVYRDELIGERARLSGYRFRVQRGQSQVPCAADALFDALQTDNVQAVAQRRLALIPMTTAQWHGADFRPLIAQGTVFLFTAAGESSPATELAPVLEQVGAAGGRTALDASLAARHAELLGHANAVLLDYAAYTLEAFMRQVEVLRAEHPALDLIADGVASWPEHRMVQAAGVRYSLGGFAATPDEEETRDSLNQSRLVLIEMLNLLRRDADLGDLEEVAKRDPGVAIKLVAMANSPLAGLTTPVASLHQALMVLGREALYRWLSLGIYRAGSSPRDETLLEIALRRARFLELAGHGIRSSKECDELFLVGMLSLLDSLLGMPMEKVLERMTLPAVVADVLLRSEGPYARFLALAMAIEKGREGQVELISRELGLSKETLDDCGREAFAWAAKAMQVS